MSNNYNFRLESNNTEIEELLTLLETKAAGIKLPTLINEGTSDDLRVNKQLINGEGNIIEGAMPDSGFNSVTIKVNPDTGILSLGIDTKEGYMVEDTWTA